jgi:hypothetical protein
MVVAVIEHGRQPCHPMLESGEMDPINEKGRTPSVPSIWIGLKRVWMAGKEMKPDVMVTGSANATPGTLAPRMVAATRKRSSLFMARFHASIELPWSRWTSDKEQPKKGLSLPNV